MAAHSGGGAPRFRQCPKFISFFLSVAPYLICLVQKHDLLLCKKKYICCWFFGHMNNLLYFLALKHTFIYCLLQRHDQYFLEAKKFHKCIFWYSFQCNISFFVCLYQCLIFNYFNFKFLLFILFKSNLLILGGCIQYETSVIEQIPMGGYIISIFAQILGSLR